MKFWLRATIVLLVLAAIAAIVALKNERTSITTATTVSAAMQPRVLLFADPREASEGQDGCAIIIRTVRAARARGIRVGEYDAGASPDVRRKYRVTVEPTVIILDAKGREVGRHEGEDARTIMAIRSDVESLTGGRI